ncbi:MAG: type II secretion system F family protein [Planctomycetota bacterium]
MFTSPLFISLAVFFGVTALVAGLAMLFRGGGANKMEDRLDLLTGAANPMAGKDGNKQASVLTHPLDDRPSLIQLFLERFGNIQLLFEQADTSLTIPKFALISAVMAGAGFGFVLLLGLSAIWAPLLALFMGAFPLMWILFRRKRRMKAFAAQLPDAMEMLARSLRSGQSLGFGFNMISNEMTNPIAREFGRVFEEQNLGIPIDESLRGMTGRIPNLDLKFFVTAVVLQRQTGGDLAEILDKIGELIRDRFRIWGQVQALTGEGRLSGIVLMGLPVALFLAVWYLNPDYVMVLFTDPMGKKMLMYAVFMQILGALCIRKIVNIQV